MSCPSLAKVRAMGVEQSNTSVIFDDTVMVKFFRRLHPGTNADVELLSALSRSHSDNVPRLFGWLEIDIDGEVFTTAMLQKFVLNSVDGWKLALGAVRDAVREADTDLELLGTDFALEARALGEAVGRVHHSLAAALPVNERLSGAELVAPMRTRLEFVSTVVPEIAELSDAAEAVFARAEAAVAPSGAVVQRIHGDLHLGQVLRTPRSWLLIDFEGEAFRPWGGASPPRPSTPRYRRDAALLRLCRPFPAIDRPGRSRRGHTPRGGLGAAQHRGLPAGLWR